MTRKKLLLLTLLLAATATLWRVGRSPPAPSQGPRIPECFQTSIPAVCRQIVLVLAPEDHATSARLWLLQRPAGGGWERVNGPMPVTLGHQGLAWGTGEHTATPLPGFRVKREGDKCSPAGVFRIPFAFGLAAAPEATWLKLPYTPLTPAIVGVDDPKSQAYNQVVDNTQVAVDWDSNEPMARRGHWYEWGAFIANNPERVPGLGSCIFFHLWTGPGEGTAGCTAMAEGDLKTMLGWLDPALEPRLVQGLEGW